MKYLFLFESFVEKLYEIRFSDHWIERTSLAFDKNSDKSRILKRSDKFPYGWRIAFFVDENGSEIKVPEFFEIVNINEKFLDSLIVKSLYELTRSYRLRRWKNEGDKENLMLNLGRIAIWDGKKKYYPYFSGGAGKDEDEYYPGDTIWGFTKDHGDIGITIKFLPSTQEGFVEMKERHRINTKLSELEFFNTSEVVCPYGENFEVIIDLTDPDPNSIERKIVDQVEGNPIILGPQPESNKMSAFIKQPIRKTLSPGNTIGVIVKYISPTELTEGTIQEIINIQDIKDAQKIKNVTSIKEIKIKFMPKGRNIGSIVTLKDGSIISIDGTKYMILGPSNGKPLITSEPSIINSGSVQTWVIPI